MTNASKKTLNDGNALLQRNFSGINNVTAEDRLTLDELRAAINVDITKEGRVSRRTGRRVVLEGISIRGLYTDVRDRMFYADTNKLYCLTPETEAVEEVLSPVNLSSIPAFCEVNGDVYFTDGTLTKIIKPDLSVTQWGVDPPIIQPSVSLGAGSLEAGEYLVTATCYTNTGEESGCRPLQKITVPANGGINVTGLFAPSDPRIVGFRVYLGTPGGKIPYHAADVPVDQNAVLLTTVQTQAAELRTMELTRPPAGSKIVYYRGRIYILVGNILYWTEPLRFGQVNMAKNYLVLPANCTMLAAVQEGLYVACDKTYFLSGRDPDQFQILLVADYGAPNTFPVSTSGTNMGLESEDVVAVWMSQNGLVMGNGLGQVSNLTQKRIAMAKYATAALAYREERGMRQVLMSGKKPGQGNRLGIGAYAIAEVRQNGVVIR